MRALIINGVCAAALLGGCSSKSAMSLVVVSVDADAPLADVATLHARVTVDTTTREFDVHPTSGATLSIPPAQNFGIDIPRTMTGTLQIHVEARDSDGNTTATGDGSGAIRVGARADIAIRLAAAVADDMTPAPGSDMAMAPGSDMAKPPGDMVVIPPAMLTIDKTMQSFGDITIGKTSTTASFLIINAGGMASSVATLTTGGADVAEFTIDTDCGPSLAPGGRCHVTASITPATAGGKTATFTLTAAQGGSVGGTLTANALTPGAVKILQPSGDCGSAIVGTQSTTTATFTVKNNGASPTTALTVGTSDPQFQATGCSGMTLAANATCTVTVKFTPSTSGTQNTSVTVSATTGGTDTASVVGVGLKPAALSVSPPSYVFNSVARGAAGDTATFTVSNSGDVASATMSAATVTGTNASSFVITADNCKGAPIGAAPASCTILVQFKPQISGSNGATLNVAAGASSVGTPSLSGVGLNPAALKLSPATFTFTKGQTTTFTVTNDGEVASSALSAATIGGTNPSSFSVVTDNCKGTTVGASPASCTISVKFAPTTTGTQSATLALSATSGGSLSSTLGGPGLNPAALTMSPASPTFTKGQTITFTVANSGEVTSGALAAAVLGGTNAASFSITADHCKTTTVGSSPASCTIDVKFAPTSTGTQSATLSITGTPGGTASSTLSGPGLNPASLRLTPDHYAFATTPRASTGETTTFHVVNDGEVAATALSPATLTGNSSSFALTDGCNGVPLGPSPASCTISVQFTPKISGVNSAVLTAKTGSTTIGTGMLSGTATPIWVAETPPAGTPKLNGVWAADPDNVYAVGNAGTILYRATSGAWSAQSLTGSSPPDLTAVSGSTATNIFVAGGDVYQSSGNGQWNPTLSSGPFTGVWAFNSADVWATWDTGINDPNTGNAVYHYTPSTGWQLARDSNNNPLHGSTSIWGTSASDLFVYGGYFRFEISINAFVTGGDIFHRDGQGHIADQFSQSKQVVPQDVSMAIRSLWGSGSPANNLYAVTTVFSGSNHSEVILHWTGAAWDQMPSPAPSVACNAVWGYDASHVLFGCADGIHQYDGATWTSSLASSSELHGLSGSNINAPNAFAVGVASDGTTGVIYHYY
ncbi:MAG: low-density lipoprotein receptor repeat protein [bacterium]|nr:low-density lipoprotein receptor repeat protein [bacterium]